MTDVICSASPATDESPMSMHHLLLRGMLVGVVAGLLAFGFAKVFGEPAVDRAIAFEAAEAHEHGEAAEEELVSRKVQASLGLLTGVVVYGCALGGLFSLAFAFCYGRVARLSPRACAALVALLGFLCLYVAPYLKYPANPPSVGSPETIGMRTGLYFSMIVLSCIALIAAVSLRRVVERRFGAWHAWIVGGLAYGIMVAVAWYALPTIDEVPATFPASTLWQFRIASLGIQAVLWAVIGLLFGELTQRSLGAGASVGSTR
jgi:predicted cobalt transporter CbtA